MGDSLPSDYLTHYTAALVKIAADTKEVKTAQKAAPAKPKVAAKAPVKPLPQMMEEDVIPQLKAILETQDELSDIELSFQENKIDVFLDAD
ncbi:hypothetical protein Prudu_013309 [Prunus dulcis]|uniref:Uncharacterized protein n=1 Tax=Prunus dulcis TaxID=3755 RepID=A0A4Y1REP9_PRUDU|nr:hypothetical protein Prudu_013309 [Prunus dulcis]